MSKTERLFLVLFLLYYAPVFLLVIAEKIADFCAYSKLSAGGKGRLAAVFAAEAAGAAAVYFACSAVVAFLSAGEIYSLLWHLIRYLIIPAGFSILLIFIFSRIELRTFGEPGAGGAAPGLARVSAPVTAVFVPVYALECTFALLVSLSSGWSLGDGIIEDLAGAFARSAGSFWGPVLSFGLIGVTFAAAVIVKCVLNRRKVSTVEFL